MLGRYLKKTFTRKFSSVIPSQTRFIQGEHDFYSAIQSPKYTIVRYSSQWCSQCANFQPSNISSNNVQFLNMKFDNTALQEIYADFNLSQSGTTGLLIFHNGQIVDSVSGSNEILNRWLEEKLNSVVS